jgi:hypothetical protein
LELIRAFISHKTASEEQGENGSFNLAVGTRNTAPAAHQDALDALAIDMLEMACVAGRPTAGLAVNRCQ